MRTLLAAVGVAGFFAAFAFAGGPNDLKTSFACSGKQCTLKVTNNSGQPQGAINIGVNSGLKIVAAKSAGTLESTFTANGKTVTVKAGQCAVMNGGMQVNCTFAPDGWAKGATKTVAITAAAAVAKGAAINVCPSNGGCRPTYFGAAPTSTTTQTEPAARPDLAATVSGPDSVELKGTLRLQYHVDVVNTGTKISGAAKAYITADIVSGKPPLVGIVVVEGNTSVSPACPHHEHGFICELPSLAPKARRSWVVTVRYPARKVKANARLFRVATHLEEVDRDDPFPNNKDQQDTDIER